VAFLNAALADLAPQEVTQHAVHASTLVVALVVHREGKQLPPVAGTLSSVDVARIPVDSDRNLVDFDRIGFAENLGSDCAEVVAAVVAHTVPAKVVFVEHFAQGSKVASAMVPGVFLAGSGCIDLVGTVDKVALETLVVALAWNSDCHAYTVAAVVAVVVVAPGS